MFSCQECVADFLSLADLRAHPCENLLLVDPQDERFFPTMEAGSSFQENKQHSEESTDEKSHAVWTRTATLALLALYEANMHMLDNIKQRGKIWEKISTELQLSSGIDMTQQQVRWKFNALNKRYKETKDNNSRSGRGNQEFQWFNVMDEMFGKNIDCSMKNHTVSSIPLSKLKKNMPSTSKCTSNSDFTETSDVKELPACNIGKSLQPLKRKRFDDDSNQRNVQRPKHGTGSKVAKTKIELENQWLRHLQMKEERDKKKELASINMMEMKKEALRLKRKQLALKEKELDQRREIADKKLKENIKFNVGILENEKRKCKTLNKYLDNKENADLDISSEFEDL